MDRFLLLIDRINNSEMEESEYLSEPTELISEISDLACELFITNSGKCNGDTIAEAGKHGINIFPVEQDRFGWLIGGIGTKKGIITYG
jgi:hypothetical protein